MPIILEDTEDDTIVQDIHHQHEPESIPASPPNEGGIRHISVVEETKVDVKEWHISRLPKTSVKCC
jgi:predicted xylose isomerase-like sugar epimerase